MAMAHVVDRVKEVENNLTTVYLKGYADAEEKYKKRIKELEEENYVQKVALLENSIPKQKVKELFDRLHINDIEPWSFYKVSGDILFDLKELLEDK